ncbi:hypothetical protein LOTGIDRAFT_230882 [Lottia gigantea]|uniref:Uncharacterized protein n=1 Tax=Lottia gigantea TaxID=225164 RepID=V4B140_LOTGI|nr:hypothetical protein LOTGIDRAFT_230882 [Lottia gigantea]ESO99956.1 hypothetical protein LOTGIDRAFT_230882 [Lottia gigantea]
MEHSSVRYEVLREEEQDVPAQPVAMAMVVPPPPPYAPVNPVQTENTAMFQGPKLPTYDDATNLPSYDEAERSKIEELQRLHDEESQIEDGPSQSASNAERLTGLAIGTDGMFICTFVVAFLFNWVGFLLSLCISNTVAGRCGALSGLGLSIVKWVAIVKHNNWAVDFAGGDSWLWWMLVVCGFLLFIRGSVQYVRIKYEMNRLTGQLREYRLI